MRVSQLVIEREHERATSTLKFLTRDFRALGGTWQISGPLGSLVCNTIVIGDSYVLLV